MASKKNLESQIFSKKNYRILILVGLLKKVLSQRLEMMIVVIYGYTQMA